MSDPAIDSVSEQLERELADLCVRERLAGAAVGIVRDQKLAWSRGVGFAHIESERPPDENTIFRVASITKTFTATAIFRLRDQGKLNIDDPIVDHIPELSATGFLVSSGKASMSFSVRSYMT